MEDFHYNSLHNKIAPLVVAWDERGGTANLRISGNDLKSTIQHMDRVWNQFVSDYPFEYHFLDQTLERQYMDDERFGRLFTHFAFFAIIIACLGLYGLSLFLTQQRTKEIGIRKASGASVKHIVGLFLRDFGLNVLIANMLAWPVSYLLMGRWLENFPYQTSISWWFFALAFTVSLSIAVVTVSYNTIKAARANPVNSLRYE